MTCILFPDEHYAKLWSTEQGNIYQIVKIFVLYYFKCVLLFTSCESRGNVRREMFTKIVYIFFVSRLAVNKFINDVCNIAFVEVFILL